MITLISGTPGTGKTAYVVNWLKSELAAGSRPVYCLGIDGLALPHLPLPPRDKWAVRVSVGSEETVTKPIFDFPAGSLIIVDEAQKLLPTRPTGAPIPDYIGAFDEHRHQGLDFWLLTQRPKNIDAHLRGLVGRHIHLRQQWNGRTLYEWAEYADVESRTERNLAARRRYVLPRSVFDLYTSASVHTHNSRRLPGSVYFFVGAVLVSVAALGYSYYRMQLRLHPESTSSSAASAPVTANGSVAVTGSGPAVAGALPVAGSSVPLTPAQFVPRIPTRPESAPLYDSARVVKSLPVVVGCMASASSCVCYTDQGTDAFLSIPQCREWLLHRPYNPFRDKTAVLADSRTAVTDSTLPIAGSSERRAQRGARGGRDSSGGEVVPSGTAGNGM